MDTIDLLDTLDALDQVEDVESEDEENDEKHEGLLSSLGVDKRGKNNKKDKKDQRSEATNDVSIYSLSAGSKIKARDLVKSLKNTVNVNLIKKSLSKVEDSRNRLSALLPKVTADKVERDAAYEDTSERVSRWEDVVKRNRHTEHLSFPLKNENMRINTVDDFVQKFRPKTPLEQEIYALLKGNKYEEQSATGLSRAEEEALRSVSIEEARRRRAGLQKHRALLSYHEAKNRRLGKIKSRRHLRTIRKQKEKKMAIAFEELQRKDPEGAKEKMKLAEKSRAEERAVLRHRQGSKWSKNQMLMGKYNEMAKVQLQEQRKLHVDLVQKNSTIVESSDDDDSDKGAMPEADSPVPPIASVSPIHLPRDNPWLRLTVKKNGAKDDAIAEGNSPRPEQLCTRSQNATLEMKNVQEKMEQNSSNEDSEGEEEMKCEILEIKERKKLREEILGHQQVRRDKLQKESIKSFKAALAKLQKGGNELEQNLNVASATELSSEENELEVGMKRRRNFQQLDQVLRTEEDISTLSELHKNVQKSIDLKRTAPTLQHIDTSKVFTLETQTIKSAEATILEDEESDYISDRMTMREAFADDDVMADFVAEKKKVVFDSKPKADDLTLPGWGEWGGVGVKPLRRKRRKFFMKPRPPPSRKDDHLGPVIINNKRDVHVAKHQVNQIPFPFTSDEQYERSIRQPIGKTWNTPSAFKKLTQPKVTTAMGTIIHPMDEEDAFDKSKPQHRKRVLQDDGYVGFGDVINAAGTKKKYFKRKTGNKKHKK